MTANTPSKDSIEDVSERPPTSANTQEKKAKEGMYPSSQRVSLNELHRDLDHVATAEVPLHVKHFSTLALIGLSCSILNTWPTSTQSLWIGLGAGGPVSVLYGTIAGTIGSLMICLSLAEVCHVYPSKAAQMLWSHELMPETSPGWQRFISYMTGFIATTGWITLTSSAPYYLADGILVNVQMFRPNFNPEIWFIFVIYMAVVFYSTLINIYGMRFMNVFNDASLFWTVIGGFVTFIVLMACSGAHNTMQSGEFIFTSFINQTGWPDGVAWIMGLLQIQYALVGADGAAHVVDEIDNPRRNAPIAIVLSCVIGGFSAFVVLISFLAAMTDVDAIIDGEGGGYLLVYLQATRSLAGATILSILNLVTLLFNVPALMIIATRMVQAFAHDGCLPFGKHLGTASIRYEAPVWANLFTTTWLTVFGVIMFGSSDALLAIQSSSVILLQFSYVPVIFLMLVRGRREMRINGIERKLSLGDRWGPIVNVAALCYIGITNIFFFFPSSYPVTSAESMNFCCAVFVITILLALGNWFVYAHRHYIGPSGTTHGNPTHGEDSSTNGKTST